MRLFAVALSLAVFAPAAQASSVTIGAFYGSNIYPFSGYSGEYQQVYSAADFSTPVTITAISFVRSLQETGTISGSFSVYFSSTSKAVNGLSTTYAANRGANNALFASGVFSSSGNTLTFTATNPFAYDPSTGNLLLDFFNNGTNGNYVGFQAGVSGDTSRVYYPGFGTTTPVTDSMGLRTTFTLASTPSATPEPSSFVLLGTGCTTLVGLIHRRRKV